MKKFFCYLIVLISLIGTFTYADLTNFTTTLDTDTKRILFGKIYTNDTDLDSRKANKTEVLQLNNSTVFTPSGNYNPATKLYVDNALAGKQNSSANLTLFGAITPSTNVQTLLGAVDYSAIRTLLSLVPGTDFYSISATDTLLTGKQNSSANLNTFSGIAPSANIQTLLSSSDYAGVRTLLSLVPGTDFYSVSATDTLLSGKQASSANLNTFSGIAPSANVVSMLSAANYSAIRTLLNLVSGTDFYSVSATDTLLAGKQASSANLNTFSGIAPSANVVSMLNAANYSAIRTLLNLVPGTDFYSVSATDTLLSGKQASSANLNTFSGIAPSANVVSMLSAANYSAIRTLLNLVPGTDFYSVSASDTLLAAKAPIANPTFTGTLTTPSVVSNSADGTHRLNVRNTVAPSWTPVEGDTFNWGGTPSNWGNRANGLWVYRGATWVAEGGGGSGTVTPSSTDTFTNKTYDAAGTGNVLSNVGVSNMASSAIVNSAAALTEAATDTKVPTWGAMLAKLNDLLVSGNPSIAITTPASPGTWVQSDTYTSFAGTAFDMQGVSAIHWKNGAGGTYVTTGVSGTTSWTVSSITLTEGLNTLYARVTDTNSNLAETSRTINLDTINPTVALGADSTHDGSGTSFTLLSSMFTETNPSLVEYWFDSNSATTWASPYNNVNVNVPADTSNHTLNLRVTDLSGRIGTDNKLFTYTSGVFTVSDTFTGTENPLVTNWTTMNSPTWLAMQKDNSGNAYGISSAAWCGAYWDLNTPSDNQAARITIAGSANYQGVILRNNANGCYLAYVHPSGRVYVNRYEKSGDNYVNILNGVPYVTISIPTNSTFELRISGSTLTCKLNDVAIGTINNDSTYTSGNYGMAVYGSAAGISLFEAGDI